MLTEADAIEFCRNWIRAWNSHDIHSIMDCYDDNVRLVSPIAQKLLGHSLIEGRKAVEDYFKKGLQAYPDLKFEFQNVLTGEQSIILLYRNQNGTNAGEFMQLNAAMKITQMFAHYGN